MRVNPREIEMVEFEAEAIRETLQPGPEMAQLQEGVIKEQQRLIKALVEENTFWKGFIRENVDWGWAMKLCS